MHTFTKTVNKIYCKLEKHDSANTAVSAQKKLLIKLESLQASIHILMSFHQLSCLDYILVSSYGTFYWPIRSMSTPVKSISIPAGINRLMGGTHMMESAHLLHYKVRPKEAV